MSTPSTADLVAFAKVEEAHERSYGVGGVRDERADLFAAIAAALEQGERDKAEPTSDDYVALLKVARARVEGSPLYRRFISGTPLENDIAVWMADFASEAGDADAKAMNAENDRHIAEIARLEERDRQFVERLRETEQDAKLCVRQAQRERDMVEAALKHADAKAERLEQALLGVSRDRRCWCDGVNKHSAECQAATAALLHYGTQRNIRGEFFTDADLKAVGQDWTEDALAPSPTGHDSACEAELTSHGYSECRCAERASSTGEVKS